MAFDIVAASNQLLALPKLPPLIRGWNRLEGRPRTVDYERALRAEVRDALWFLTRQWQFGEFQGEDTGSPIDARVVLRETQLTRYAARGQAAADYDRSLPLETRVECEAIPFDLTLHVQVSRYLFGLIADRVPAARLEPLRAFYRTHYPLTELSVREFADADSRAVLALATRNALDARALLHAIATGLHATLVGGTAALLPGEAAILKVAATDLEAWFKRLYSQPNATDEQSWAPRYLEYQFACATQAQDLPDTVLAATEYTSGHLDWYAFDVDARAEASLGDSASTPPAAANEAARSFIPAPVSFGGMPAPRYWEMENRKTEFADIDQNTTDVAKLLLTEFALVYSNDWCVIPHEIAVGSLCEVRGLMLTDDFGEQILIRAAGRGVDDAWQRWAMYTLSTNSADGAADTRLFVPPALTKTLEGDEIEKTHFLRDEMANMVWAIERVVPTALGVGANGYDVARADAPAPPPEVPLHATTAKVRYVLGTEVPGNWFPFIPVHRPGSQRDVELQRARMPEAERRIRGAVLSPPSPYFINEEEVPRAGKIVTRGWQRGRWLDGSIFVWIGRRAATGKGEGSSGLAFDQVRGIKNVE